MLFMVKNVQWVMNVEQSNRRCKWTSRCVKNGRWGYLAPTALFSVHHHVVLLDSVTIHPANKGADFILLGCTLVLFHLNGGNDLSANAIVHRPFGIDRVFKGATRSPTIIAMHRGFDLPT